MKTTEYRNGLAVRIVETAETVADVDQIAAGTGEDARFARSAVLAIEVLTKAGFAVAQNQFGYGLLPGAPWPDIHETTAPGRAAWFLMWHHIAARALKGADVGAAFRVGARLGEAALHLDLAVAGWPQAAELGDKQIKAVRKGGVEGAKVRTQEADERIAVAQRLADEKWRRRPRRSNLDVAAEIVNENKHLDLGSANTLRRKLRRPA